MRTGFADILRSLAFYIVFYGGSVLYVLAVFATLTLGQTAFRRAVRRWSHFHRTCARVLLGIRVVVEGQVPREGVLIAMKHESFFEAIDLTNLYGEPAIFAKEELLRIPLWGRLGRIYGLIGVERDQGARALRAMLRAARHHHADGRVLVIFPEGTRVPHGTRAPLQAGFAGLYKLLGLPVVPVSVDSGPLYHRIWKRPGTITIRVGEPIPAGLPRPEIDGRVQAAINMLNRPEQD